MTIDLLIHSANQVLTLSGGAPKRGAGQDDLGLLNNGAVAVSGDRIVAVGDTLDLMALAGPGTIRIDARGKTVLPGFVDAHTHVVFAGDRAHEFELRLEGATYQQIQQRGGGIMSTVRATREATLGDVVAQSRARLERMLVNGTTTAEVKTGYGLNTETELKLLKAIQVLETEQPVDLVPTFLGAHVIPHEFIGKEDQLVSQIVDEMMPAIQKANLHFQNASLYCDVFCDDGAFDLKQTRRILTRAKEMGWGLRIHVDEFVNLGAARLAAELGAASADHLMVTRREDIRAMAEAGVTAVLLPGTTFGLGMPDFANGRLFIGENVPVALGTDLNPGTCWCESMPLILALACRYERLTPAEAIVAGTLNAAACLGMADRVGSLEVGKLADVLIADVPDYRHLAYRFGANPIQTVVKRGRVVAGP